MSTTCTHFYLFFWITYPYKCWKRGNEKVKDYVLLTSGEKNKEKQNEFAQSKKSFYFLSGVLKISFIVNHITSI